MKTSVVRALGLFACVLVAGAANAQTMQVVEWPVSDGGNGHWYGFVSWPSRSTWRDSRKWAEDRGSHLVTLTSGSEDTFVTNTLMTVSNMWNGVSGPWIGAFGTAPCSGGNSCFQWVTGEPFSYTRWHPGNPDNILDSRGGLTPVCFWEPGWTRAWQDQTEESYAQPNTRSAVVEWDTDCNGDGIVDYGQIQSGQLQDDNQNNVPDICEYTVTGVIPVSGAASGGTSVIINGTNFPQNPAVLIGGSAATDVVRVSANRITAVTPVGLPGMTSVAVGNWVQPNAFYYRPECGSDLDQDGEVTASDIAIVLLDFGPCYATATSSQPADSTPFLLKEEPVLGTLGAR